MLKEFKEFAIKGNAFELAVGIVIGAAFSTIVNSLVNDIIMPPFSLILGKVNFVNLYINLSGVSYSSLDEAKKAGAITINYGAFINNVIIFLIISFVLFLFIKQINLFRRSPNQAPNNKQCPFCFSTIALKATRCPNCTSELK